MTEEIKDIPIPGPCLHPPYSDELYAFCKKVDDELGLRNGPTALYWYLQHVVLNAIDMHNQEVVRDEY